MEPILVAGVGGGVGGVGNKIVEFLLKAKVTGHPATTVATWVQNHRKEFDPNFSARS